MERRERLLKFGFLCHVCEVVASLTLLVNSIVFNLRVKVDFAISPYWIAIPLTLVGWYGAGIIFCGKIKELLLSLILQPLIAIVVIVSLVIVGPKVKYWQDAKNTSHEFGCKQLKNFCSCTKRLPNKVFKCDKISEVNVLVRTALLLLIICLLLTITTAILDIILFFKFGKETSRVSPPLIVVEEENQESEDYSNNRGPEEMQSQTNLSDIVNNDNLPQVERDLPDRDESLDWKRSLPNSPKHELQNDPSNEGRKSRISLAGSVSSRPPTSRLDSRPNTAGRPSSRKSIPSRKDSLLRRIQSVEKINIDRRDNKEDEDTQEDLEKEVASLQRSLSGTVLDMKRRPTTGTVRGGLILTPLNMPKDESLPPVPNSKPKTHLPAMDDRSMSDASLSAKDKLPPITPRENNLDTNKTPAIVINLQSNSQENLQGSESNKHTPKNSTAEQTENYNDKLNTTWEENSDEMNGGNDSRVELVTETPFEDRTLPELERKQKDLIDIMAVDETTARNNESFQNNESQEDDNADNRSRNSVENALSHNTRISVSDLNEVTEERYEEIPEEIISNRGSFTKSPNMDNQSYQELDSKSLESKGLDAEETLKEEINESASDKDKVVPDKIVTSKNTNNEEQKPNKPKWHPPWQLTQEIIAHLPAHSIPIVCLESYNKWFATGSSDTTIKIWDMNTGFQRLTIKSHKASIRSMIFGASGHRFLYSSGDDRQLICNDIEVNRVITSFPDQSTVVYGMSLYSPSDLLVTCGRDKLVKVWDNRLEKSVRTLRGHLNTVSSVTTIESTRQIVSGSHDSTLRVWDIGEGRCIQILTGHHKSVRAIELHPEEPIISSASTERIIHWQMPQAENIGEILADQISINCLAVNPQGVLVAGGSKGSIHLWDWKAGHKFQKIHRTKVYESQEVPICVWTTTFDRTGSKLIASDAGNVLKLYKEAYTRVRKRINFRDDRSITNPLYASKRPSSLVSEMLQ